MTDVRGPSFSFEFFPPRTPEAVTKLAEARRKLALLEPEFISVTFGAGGSTREGTLNAVLDIIADGIEGAPHLTCVGSTRASMRELLAEYRRHGIRRLVALRGDLPSGWGGDGVGALRYANELVEFIRAETGDWFHIEVAAYPEMHPQAPSMKQDLDSFVRKVGAGADSAITQLFFNADAYLRFVDDARARGVGIPIVPGIMPITNHAGIKRFCTSCGADLPRWIETRLADYGDDLESIRAFGLDVVENLCRRVLAEGAPGLHFYTMNGAATTTALWDRLDLGAMRRAGSGRGQLPQQLVSR
ncbi:methylenetetrahydrofolate reductase [NAD(P)H] [soil metagenome]